MAKYRGIIIEIIMKRKFKINKATLINAWEDMNGSERLTGYNKGFRSSEFSVMVLNIQGLKTGYGICWFVKNRINKTFYIVTEESMWTSVKGQSISC